MEIVMTDGGTKLLKAKVVAWLDAHIVIKDPNEGKTLEFKFRDFAHYGPVPGEPRMYYLELKDGELPDSTPINLENTILI
jgi:hypothetical protein